MTSTKSVTPGVGPETEHPLRDAMGRLLGGRPHTSDGRLIKKNLALEAT